MKLNLRGWSYAFATVLCTAAVAAGTEGTPPDDGEVKHLAPFVVKETKISDFGLSIVTNFGVIWGGKIEWMRVGKVVPGSAAALAQLNPDDEIALIDGQPRSGMSRETMLRIFFQRKMGDIVSLELRDSRTHRLRLVVLKVNRQGLER
jgi:hypothetical protein